MKIVIAIDSFKGSMSSMEAGLAAKQGVLRVFPQADVKVCPVADGGEGTTKALVEGMNGKLINLQVTGPLGQPVCCSYGILGDGTTAVIEMAAAAGLTLIPNTLRNPMNTTTYGVGEIIRDAIQKGCRNFIIGIGGSATNDGGVGMLKALGYCFTDENNNPILDGAKGLQHLTHIDDSSVIPKLKECTFNVACDVTNVLCGKTGCSAVFGPQKGATLEMVIQMDSWLNRFAQLCKDKYPASDSMYPGSGAAGGLGFAFLTFLNAELTSGVDLVLNKTDIEKYIKKADIVITGEGCLDEQTSMGKTPAGVARIAKKYNKTVLAFAGCVSASASTCNSIGIDAYFPILPSVMPLSEAMENSTARKNLVNAVEQVFRLIQCSSNPF